MPVAQKDNSVLQAVALSFKLASHQVLPRSSFVQKNGGSICCVCIKYSNCLRRVNVRYSKTVFRHVNPLEQIIELSCSASGVPGASEPGQMLANLLEGHAVAPIILTRSSKTHTTARKHLAYYLRNLAHAIVVRSIGNIEYFVMNRFGGSLQHRDNGPRNVQPMDERPPGSPVTSHLDLFGRPCQARPGCLGRCQ